MQLFAPTTGTATGGTITKQVQNPVRDILVTIFWTAFQPSTLAEVFSLLDQIMVDITYYGEGPDVAANNVPLSVFVDYAAAGEGVVPLEQEDEDVIQSIVVPITIGADGAVQLLARDRQFDITLSGIPGTAAGGDNFTIALNGLEAPVQDAAISIVDTYAVATDLPVKTLYLEDAETIMIDTQEIDRIHINYPRAENKTVIYTASELNYISAQTNDLVVLGRCMEFKPFAISSHYRWVALDVRSVLSIDVYKPTTTSSTMYAFRQKQVAPIEVLTTSAASLVDTTQVGNLKASVGIVA